MSVESEETVSLIRSIDSLVKSLSFKNLENEDVREALNNLKKSRGFKRMVGDLSSVHVLKFGSPESYDGSQRFRLANKETDYETINYVADDMSTGGSYKFAKTANGKMRQKKICHDDF
jgi:hypothetical protein